MKAKGKITLQKLVNHLVALRKATVAESKSLDSAHVVAGLDTAIEMANFLNTAATAATTSDLMVTFKSIKDAEAASSAVLKTMGEQGVVAMVEGKKVNFICASQEQVDGVVAYLEKGKELGRLGAYTTDSIPAKGANVQQDPTGAVSQVDKGELLVKIFKSLTSEGNKAVRGHAADRNQVIKDLSAKLVDGKFTKGLVQRGKELVTLYDITELETDHKWKNCVKLFNQAGIEVETEE